MPETAVITEEIAQSCPWCGVMIPSNRRYCSERCSNKSRMQRYRANEIRDKWYPIMEKAKELERWALLQMTKELEGLRSTNA